MGYTGKGKIRKAFVQWKDWSMRFNTWIPALNN